MQPAQRARHAGQRIIDVDEARRQPGRREFALAKHPREKAALVAALLQLDEMRAGERGLLKLHSNPQAWRVHRKSPSSRPAWRCASSIFSRMKGEARNS